MDKQTTKCIHKIPNENGRKRRKHGFFLLLFRFRGKIIKIINNIDKTKFLCIFIKIINNKNNCDNIIKNLM